MLSVAGVRSASGAANYFAKDDYYTVEGSSEISAWGGEGAADLGLSGEVTKDAFEGILNGILPGDETIRQVENRRSGYDLTFSAPKSIVIAPASFARARRSGTLSMAITRLAPSRKAERTENWPTGPAPIPAMVSPGWMSQKSAPM